MVIKKSKLKVGGKLHLSEIYLITYIKIEQFPITFRFQKNIVRLSIKSA